MSRPDLTTLRSTLRALPPGSLVPAEWVLDAVENIDADGREHRALGLTVGEFANEADRAPSTVRTWCNEGRLPGAKKLRGREWRIPRSALTALLDDDTPARAGGAERLEVPRGGLSAWRDAR